MEKVMRFFLSVSIICILVFFVFGLSLDLRADKTNCKYRRFDKLCPDHKTEKTICKDNGDEDCTSQYCTGSGNNNPFLPLWY